MLDFRARRKLAAADGLMDEGVEWISQMDGSLFRARPFRKKGKCQLRSVLGDVEFADDTVTFSAASSAEAVEGLFDETLRRDWSQRRNIQKTERLLAAPNAPRVPGSSEATCSEAGSRIQGCPACRGFSFS